MRARHAGRALGVIAMAACGGDEPWDFQLPGDIPAPIVPEDNPLTVAKVELGRHLFYDTRLSGDGSIACVSCHLPEHAFADPRPQSVGAHGDLTRRNSPGLQNVAYYATLTWASPSLTRIEDFLLLPMFGDDPVEMGITGREDDVMARLRADEDYVRMFRRAFGEGVTLAGARDALASFTRAMVSFDSPFDRFSLLDQPDALSETELRGMDHFFSEKFECHHCHAGMHLSRSLAHERLAFSSIAFDNIGLFESYPPTDPGLSEVTGRAADDGRFRPPSLRNVAHTAPYMHNGSFETLEEVLAHYARAGTLTGEGPHAGDGALHPSKSVFVPGFNASEQEIDEMLAFLRALTDMSFLDDKRFSNPFLR